MARKYRKFSPEFRDEAVQLVIDGSRPIAQVARELGVNEGTLGSWVNQYRKDHAGDEPPLSPVPHGPSTAPTGSTARCIRSAASAMPPTWASCTGTPHVASAE